MNSDAAAWVPLFQEEEVPFILLVVSRCCNALKKKHNEEREDNLSNRLRLLIRRDPAFRQSGFIVDREVPVFDDESDVENPIGRIDFRFLSAQRRTDSQWHFVLEAKRLHVTFKKAGWKSLISEYVTGHQGMMCFVDQRYARSLCEGAMLGYVFDGDVERARDAVSDSIATNPDKLKCVVPFRLPSSKIVAGLPSIGESLHDFAGNLFTIYHMFVAV